MENTNYDPPMLRRVVELGAFVDDPFSLVDVGCGLGIDRAWRLFGDQLTGHGFDPQIAEIERLRAAETGSINYHAAFVGLPGDHPIVRRRAARQLEDEYFEPFARTSAAAAQRRAAEQGDASFYETNAWMELELATETVGLADALRRERVETVDFVKVDTDGTDLDVLISFEEMLEPARVLGLMVETPFSGSADESANAFHNIDPLLKRHGFQVYAMSASLYSRASLPATFTYDIFAQTVSGQPLWADLVYLRDAVHRDWRRYGDLSPTKLLKLACLYELFCVPDCAVELLLAHRHSLTPLVDVHELVELLTPRLGDEVVSYREYVAAFADDSTRFYPEPERDPEPDPPPQTLVQRARHLAARATGRA